MCVCLQFFWVSNISSPLHLVCTFTSCSLWEKKLNFLRIAELTPSLSACLANNTSSGLLWSPGTTYPPFEIWQDWDRKLLDVFCSFYPCEIQKEWQKEEIKEAVSAVCLLPVHRLTDVHLCTHSYALSHYFMTHLLCMVLLPHFAIALCFRQERDCTQRRLERCCSLCWHPEEDLKWKLVVSGRQFAAWLWAWVSRDRTSYEQRSGWPFVGWWRGVFCNFWLLCWICFPQNFWRHQTTEATLRRTIRKG